MAHEAISAQLSGFVQSDRVPNVLLWGDPGSGKKTLLTGMLRELYGDEDSDKLIMRVECGRGKGIKFIREELKFFGQSLMESSVAKSVVLLNGDRLTLDAQSALRRCIELYNHSTRFFMVVEDKHKLLSPILSRFCAIHVPRALVSAREVNFHSVAFKEYTAPPDTCRIALRQLASIDGDPISAAQSLYEKGCTVFDVMGAIEKTDMDDSVKFSILAYLESERLHVDNDIVLLYVAVCLFKTRTTDALGSLPLL